MTNPIPLDSITVSTVAHAKATKTTEERLVDVLSDIRGGRWAQQIEAVRQANAEHGKAAADKLKIELSGVLFSGTFSRRKMEHLKCHSGVLCVDLDNLNEDLVRVRGSVEADPYTLACFLSPRGNGLKVLVRIPADVERHKESAKAVFALFRERHGVIADSKCQDVSRMCFVSFDPCLFLNSAAIPCECDIDHTEYIDHSDNTDNTSHIGSSMRVEERDGVNKAYHVLQARDVDDIIRATQPKTPGQRHGCVFNLARGLRFEAGMEKASVPELKKLVRKWFDQSLPIIATKDFTETWADFVHAWPRVRLPLGRSPIEDAWARVKRDPLPAVCNEYDNASAKHLLALCFHMQRKDGTFYLAMRNAEKHIGCTLRAVARYFAMFIEDGLLELVKKGDRHHANTYRWMKSNTADESHHAA